MNQLEVLGLWPHVTERVPQTWADRNGLSAFGAVAQVEVPHVMTPIAADEAAKLLAKAYRTVTGRSASVAILGLLLAQWALETGNGKSVHNWNFGNAKRNSGSPYYTYFTAWEMVDGQRVDSRMAFAAYKTALDGAVAYIKVLKSRPNWWNGLLTGNIESFNKGLSTNPKYYTADPGTYLSALKNRSATFLPQAKRYGATLIGSVGQVVVGLGLGFGILKVWQRYKT